MRLMCLPRALFCLPSTRRERPGHLGERLESRLRLGARCSSARSPSLPLLPPPPQKEGQCQGKCVRTSPLPSPAPLPLEVAASPTLFLAPAHILNSKLCNNVLHAFVQYIKLIRISCRRRLDALDGPASASVLELRRHDLVPFVLAHPLLCCRTAPQGSTGVREEPRGWSCGKAAGNMDLHMIASC